jgi:NitT/TauT family transport system permease protein
MGTSADGTPGPGMTRRLADACWLAGGLLLFWQAVALVAGPDALAPPVTTVAKLGHMLTTGVFWGHIAETGEAYIIALMIAIVAGLSIGVLIGIHRLSAQVAEPFLLAANSVPKIALYPIVLLVFGIGMPAKIAFGAMHGIVPIAIFTITGCRNVAPVLLKTARVMRLGQVETIRSILLPASLPDIFTGIRIGVSLTLIGTILGEMFGSQRGLGFLLMTAIGLQNTEVIMAVTLLLVIFAATVSTVLIALDRRLHRAR